MTDIGFDIPDSKLELFCEEDGKYLAIPVLPTALSS